MAGMHSTKWEAGLSTENYTNRAKQFQNESRWILETRGRIMLLLVWYGMVYFI